MLLTGNSWSAGFYLLLSLGASQFPVWLTPVRWTSCATEDRLKALELYSYRNAAIGSVRAARRAGITAATMDDAISTRTAVPSTPES